MTMIPLPEQFKLAQYRLTLKALEPLHLPEFKGSALRGGFGHTFKRLVCAQPDACDKACRLNNRCPYGYIFETSPPADSEVLRNFREVPRAFVIQPASDRRTEIAAGEQLVFHLTLVGQGIQYLPYFIAVFRELGYQGFGRSRGRYRLQTVEAVSAIDRNVEPIYQADDDAIHNASFPLTGLDIEAYARQWSGDRLRLNFVTPTRLKHRGRWIEDGPPFEVLVKTLLGRVSSLSYFHCGQLFEADFRGLIDRAATVAIEASDTRWQDWSRFSGRQKRRIEMGGLAGCVTYAGDVAPYLPLLALGQFIHVGKGTVFGNGQYRINA
ncbi:MAG: CRISPR system precrRNA processing endoribonuclease RAMP protein Cas6 [Anaerolineae bacterium]|nr:CRISPR system precrRNA processing endoribonuclease RAMP protein Cas6 [Anaerolineae bacterium]